MNNISNGRWKTTKKYERGDLAVVEFAEKCKDGHIVSNHTVIIEIWNKFRSFFRLITTSNKGTNRKLDTTKLKGNHNINKESYISEDIFMTENENIRPLMGYYDLDDFDKLNL